MDSPAAMLYCSPSMARTAARLGGTPMPRADLQAAMEQADAQAAAEAGGAGP